LASLTNSPDSLYHYRSQLVQFAYHYISMFLFSSVCIQYDVHHISMISTDKHAAMMVVVMISDSLMYLW